MVYDVTGVWYLVYCVYESVPVTCIADTREDHARRRQSRIHGANVDLEAEWCMGVIIWTIQTK